MPEGGGDPDKFIRNAGIKAFRDLEHLDVFSWRLHQAVKNGEDPIELCDKSIKLITNEPNKLYQLEMARKLAKQTGQPENVVMAEVFRRLDSDLAAVPEQKNSLIQRMMDKIYRDPDGAGFVLEETSAQLAAIDDSTQGFSVQRMVKEADQIFERMEKNNTKVELITGYAMLDEKMRGIPRREKFISVPGKPGTGKSTLFDNLAFRLPENNPDVIVMYHTVDDSKYERGCRLMSAKWNVPSCLFEAAGYWLAHPEEAQEKYHVERFNELYRDAVNWFRELVKSGQLFLGDSATLLPSLPALQGWVRKIRKQYPEHSLVLMADNFSQYDLPGFSDHGESWVAGKSHFIKRMTVSDQLTAMFTMEVTKSDLAVGKRPTMASLKGSSAMPFDVNANFATYNDLSDRMDAATMYWEDREDPEDLEEVYNPGGGVDHVPAHKFIFEVTIDKNKVSGWRRKIFFRLWPESGKLEECEPAEQLRMQCGLRNMVAPRAGVPPLHSRRVN